MFSNDFVAGLSSAPYEAIREACQKFNGVIRQPLVGGEEKRYENFVDALALLTVLLDVAHLDVNIPELSGIEDLDIETIVEVFEVVEAQVEAKFARERLESTRQRYAAGLGQGFYYEFSDEDVSRIQGLTNELRDLVSQTSTIDEEHRLRLLKRLEKFQSELHKRVSDLDRFWGLVGECGAVVYKLGRDAGPIIQRVREIVDIVWKAQVIAMGLPLGAPPVLDIPTRGDDDGLDD